MKGKNAVGAGALDEEVESRVDEVTSDGVWSRLKLGRRCGFPRLDVTLRLWTGDQSGVRWLVLT